MDALPPTLASTINALERRIEILERSNQLLASTIVGGSLIVKDSDQVEIARVGRLVSGFDGLRVQTAALEPVLEADQERGTVVPWISTPWVNNSTFTSVTSGAMDTIWQTATELLFSYSILFRVRVTTGAGTTGELQLVHAQTATVLGTVKSLPAATDAFYEFRYIHGISMNSGPHTFSLQARRTAGANNVDVYVPYPFSYGANMTPAVGGWV